MRVYELAKKLGVESKDIVVLLEGTDFAVKSHMAVLSDSALLFIEKHYAPKKEIQKTVPKECEPKTPVTKQQEPKNKELAKATTMRSEEIKTEKKVETHKPIFDTHHDEVITPPVLDIAFSSTFHEDEEEGSLARETARRLLRGVGIDERRRRRSKRRRAHAQQQEVAKEEESKKQVTSIVVSGSMPVCDVADLFGKPSSELILFLLKRGMVCNRNHILTTDIIQSLGNAFGVSVIVKEENKEQTTTRKSQESVIVGGHARWPVVVVMGHVDHGKTTLLDYIRKKRVAATEAGGITQHIRAWEVDSKHGKIVFLDTPGHEAFSYLRQRGASVTDLVVLVVAADDGIKPQTIEAIEHAKNSGVPVIVAINKIDKVPTTAPIETIKRQLAERDLLPEEWGGNTVIVPISAKTGQGVDELLEMIVLQSELMDLKADVTKPAKAFVLESHFQKGYGSVSTVICAEGTLHQGDYFTCGKTTGKVRILISSSGKRIESAGPSLPVMVVGFDTFPEMGEWLTVISQKDYLLAKSGRLQSNELPVALVHQAGIGMQDGKALNLIIKTDTRGSKEAITNLLEKLEKLAKEVKCSINIVLSSIGDITFSDVELAENTNAVLIGLHVRAEKNAQLEAKKKNIDINFFDIIYKMVDFLKELVESKREILKVWNKVGEAEVRKVFVIENAVIAGCYVKEGVLSRGNKVECLRRGKKVGEGKVNSLQRDRKTVKEIHAGYECGFISDLFEGWEVGDTVVCYAEGRAPQ